MHRGFLRGDGGSIFRRPHPSPIFDALYLAAGEPPAPAFLAPAPETVCRTRRPLEPLKNAGLAVLGSVPGRWTAARATTRQGRWRRASLKGKESSKGSKKRGRASPWAGRHLRVRVGGASRGRGGSGGVNRRCNWVAEPRPFCASASGFPGGGLRAAAPLSGSSPPVLVVWSRPQCQSVIGERSGPRAGLRRVVDVIAVVG